MVLALAFEATLGARRFADPDASRDDLSAAGMSTMRALQADLANAAWFYDWVDTDNDGLVDAGESVNYRFPWVNPAWVGPAGTVANGRANAPDGTAVSTTAAAGTLKGDRLAFFHLLTDTTPRDTPGEQQPLHVNFNDPAQGPIRMSRSVDARPVPGLVMNEAAIPGSDTNFVSQRWESNRDNTYAENRDLDNLRCYLYVVERNANGMGRLVRKYRNSAAWADPLVDSQFVSETALCDWVESITFATRTTDGTLNPNQVRVVLVLRRALDDGTGLSVTRRFESTIAMRSITIED